MSTTYFDTDELLDGEKSFPLDLREFFQKRRDFFATLIDQSLETAFIKLGREIPLLPITLQLMLSEAVEHIAGISISKDIWRHRGFLACLERAKVLYSVFESLFASLDQAKASVVVSKGVSALNRLMNDLWSGGSWGLVRPGTIQKPFNPQETGKALQILHFQLLLAKKLGEIVEFNPTIQTTLDNIPTLHREEILWSGMTGPLKRASGLHLNRKRVNTVYPHKSTEYFFQYAYSNLSHPSVWQAYRICYVELYLSINRLYFLLNDYSPPARKDDLDLAAVTGETTIHLSTPLGSSYLTLSMNEGQVAYFNYVPAEMKNWRGFSKIFSLSVEVHHNLLMPLFAPKTQIG